MRYTLLAAAIIFADQATKHWVRLSFPAGVSRPIIPGVLYLTHVQNPGAAFGLFRGYTPLLIAITAFVLIVTFVNRRSLAREKPLLRLGYSLSIAGAIGNFIDRIVLGGVTDFIDLSFFWPVFNLADAAITIGVLLLLWGIVTDREGPDEKEPENE